MQRSRLFASLAAFIMASTIIMSVSAAAYQVKPAVEGTDSGGIINAQWRKNQGLNDASGKEAFALLLRKNGLTSEPVSAKGIVQNEKGAKLEDLAFWVRDDGQCGALAPPFRGHHWQRQPSGLLPLRFWHRERIARRPAGPALDQADLCD